MVTKDLALTKFLNKQIAYLDIKICEVVIIFTVFQESVLHQLNSNFPGPDTSSIPNYPIGGRQIAPTSGNFHRLLCPLRLPVAVRPRFHDDHARFTGMVGAGNTQYGGIIAIDDVTFNKECTTGMTS